MVHQLEAEREERAAHAPESEGRASAAAARGQEAYQRTAKITARMCRFGFPYVSSSRVEFAQSRGQIHEHLMACRFDAHCIEVMYLCGYVCGRVA